MATKTANAEREKKIEELATLLIASLQSNHTKDAYNRALQGYLQWRKEHGNPDISKQSITAFMTHFSKTPQREGSDKLPGVSSYNQTQAAVRKLAMEAADDGIITMATAYGIQRIHSRKQQGTRQGNWLTVDQVEKLLAATNNDTKQGARDCVALSLLVACGLRRSELANLTYGYIGQRDGRWGLIDIIGKGNKTRTVIMPDWCKRVIDDWALVAGHAHVDETGRVIYDDMKARILREILKGDHISDTSMSITPNAIMLVLDRYSPVLGLDHPIHPHDLRRTHAKLARAGGAPLEQIQMNLGHASISTTQIYLGSKLDTENPTCDFLGIEPNAALAK